MVMYEMIGSGVRHTCALTPGGAADCWGAPQTAPSQTNVPSGGNYSALSVGGFYTCAIEAAGATADCWGQPGITVPTTSQFSSISAGWRHACALDQSGSAKCWGEDGHGHLVKQAPEGGSFSAISAGRDHTCALKTEDGTAVCWGENNVGQSSAPGGDALPLPCSPAPPALEDFEVKLGLTAELVDESRGGRFAKLVKLLPAVNKELRYLGTAPLNPSPSRFLSSLQPSAPSL